MTRKAIEIKSELDKTQSRIAELEMERERQTLAVEGAEKAFIDGKADVAKLNDAQGKLSLYERTIESLRATYQRLKAAFENQSASEKRTELLRRMATSANEVEPLVDDYLKTRNEFHELIKKYAEKLFSNAEIYRNKQSEYRAIVAELEPTDVEIQESKLDQRTRTMASATYFNHPPLEFAEVVHLAENLLAAKINKAAQFERTAEFNKKRAEKNGSSEASLATSRYSL